jgi:hypothetical protein
MHEQLHDAGFEPQLRDFNVMMNACVQVRTARERPISRDFSRLPHVDDPWCLF